jgi:glycosyltransferase involved in cell wall biosynthesis
LALRVLLLHQNFPGQFQHLAPALVNRGDDVVAVGRRTGSYPALAGRLRWLATGGNVHNDLRHGDPERRLLAPWHQARRVVDCLTPLAASGWRPDVVLAHCFWGDALLLDDLFPAAPLVALLELDLSSPQVWGGAASPGRRQLQQWADALAIRRMAVGLTASRFQRDSYPAWLHPRLRVIHEGVDLQACAPDPLARLQLPGGVNLGPEAMVLSFAARSLEPLRGLDRLLAVLPALQRRLPRLQVVLAGACDRGCYGAAPPGSESWLAHLLARLGDSIDRSRLHTPGLLPRSQLRCLFQISRLHAYLSRPYVPSWSLLEAMACGAPVLASHDAGVEGLVLEGVNGRLLPADDPHALLDLLVPLLEQPAAAAALRLGARRHVAAHFDHRHCVSAQIELLDAVARGQELPSP